VPTTTIVDISIAEQARMVAELRRARYGYLLALHLLLLCAAGRTPSEIAAVLFCSRSSVYRIVKAYRAGTLTFDVPTAQDASRARVRVLTPTLQRSLLAILGTVPWACGWCRTRWSCATSAETIRRWLHELGWVWKRAKLAAKDDDPRRVEKLARIRHTIEQLPARAALFFADELDISLLPKVGYQWTPKGEQFEVLTPGTNEKRYLAGAWDMRRGTIVHQVWWRKTHGLFLDLLGTLDRAYPPLHYTHLYLVVDNYKIHKAQAVERWLAAHPRFKLLFLPTYCPQANPIERAFGDVHDKCTRNHKRKRLRTVVSDVAQHLVVNGPWQYELSAIYYTPEVTAAVQTLATVSTPPGEGSQLAA
jgi:transposase